jgi:hypothetical protein
MSRRGSGCCQDYHWDQTLVIALIDERGLRWEGEGTPKEDAQMTRSEGGGRQRFRRWLAAIALVGIYFLSTVGIVMMMGVASVQAARRSGGSRGVSSRGVSRGGSRGFVRGRRVIRGGGVYYGGYDDGCWWSPRYRRWICPYY